MEKDIWRKWSKDARCMKARMEQLTVDLEESDFLNSGTDFEVEDDPHCVESMRNFSVVISITSILFGFSLIFFQWTPKFCVSICSVSSRGGGNFRL
jgi:hypothetical protein